MKTDNSQLHVRIDEPIKIRRNILESAIEAAEALKIYERFKAIRKEKVRQEKELKGIIKELAVAMDNLEKSLPSAPHEEKPKMYSIKPEVKEKPIKPRLEQKTKLEIDLDEIKEKLSRI